VKINIEGAIIPNDYAIYYDWAEMDYTSPNKVKNMIKNAVAGEELEVYINSGGGSVFAGFDIYTALKEYGNVTVKVTGMAGSSASVIALAGKKILMSPPAQMMIHNVSGTFQGDYNDMQLGAEILKGLNTSISNVYKLKTGKEHNELLQLMNNETYMTAQKAIELGFADEIMFVDNQNIFKNSFDIGETIPQMLINKLRNELMFNNMNKPNLENQALDLAKAKLNLAIIK